MADEYALLPELRREGGGAMSDLKPCPHCGETKSLEYATRREEEDCPRFEDCEAKECKRGACDYFDTWDSVVCSVNSGGCGAAGGYASCPAKAAEKWNRRAEPMKGHFFYPWRYPGERSTVEVGTCALMAEGVTIERDGYCAFAERREA